MKMKRILFFFLAISVYAKAGPFPLVTSINPVYVGNNGWNYYITQRVMEVGPSVDVVPASGEVLFGHRHNPHTTNVFNATYDAWIVQANNHDTISQLAMQLYNKYGKDTEYVWHQGDDYGKDECVGYVYSFNSNQNGVPWSTVKPPAMCMNVPPPNEWCKITTPQLYIDHGTITLKEAEGHSSSTVMSVDCSTSIAVEFHLITDEPYIYLTPSGKAEITVDDKPMKSKVSLPSGTSQLTIKDVLSGVTAEGKNTGSSVLVMMPY
ncbi:hypothetical protein [Cronobacter sakazakii]|uniref:hypothetical protein n=1 Tax=Cronobacter sakazakii TaxID=28141 RepID=UPI00105666D3|nr:hypothetical protein [Cronobacter sakazakii]